MKVVLLGAPGAGKGTQAKRISDFYAIPHISTGDIFRENIKNGTELGQLAKSYMDKGQLVPDEVVVSIVEDRLKKEDCQKGWLLDGFPRTLEQAESLAKFTDVDVVLDIEADFGLLEDRLCGRRVCPGCGASYHISTYSEPDCERCGQTLVHRDDDTKEVVRSRLEVYEKQTRPLIEYYAEKGVLKTVDGNLPIEECFAQIREIL